jgi:hypothetical protein
MKNKFITSGVVMIICLAFFSCSSTIKQTTSDTAITGKWIDMKLKNAANQYKYFLTKIPEGVMPRSFTKDTLRTCASKNCEKKSALFNLKKNDNIPAIEFV